MMAQPNANTNDKKDSKADGIIDGMQDLSINLAHGMVVGSKSDEPSDEAATSSLFLGNEISPDIEHMVREALQSQGDLREYSKNIEHELREAENESIKDYIRESGNIATLHNQIDECDKILEVMEKMLLGFQYELGSLSNEIETLQRQSINMSVQLCNRQAVRGELSQFVDDMIVPQVLITTILETKVTDTAFLEQLRILGQKTQFIQTFHETKAAKDVQDVVRKLTIKAIDKVREYLISEIYKFRKPVTNYQIPQNGLLKHRFAYEFLLGNEKHVAKEVKDIYVDTMSKVYFSYFKTYASRLAKKQTTEAAGKEHVLGASEEVRGKNPFFSLGNRADLLNDLEAPAIIPHAWTGLPLPYEAVFRSLIFTLVDNACREYLFLHDFFLLKGQHLLDLFHQVMGKTLSQMLTVLEEGASSSYDTVGLLLCLHVILRLQLVSHKRAVPALDHFFTAALDQLWPYLDRSLAENAYSLQRCEILPTDVNPHFITRRYAELSSGLAVVDAGFPQERLRKSLHWLQDEINQNLIRMAGVFQDRSRQLVFLINNYDLILAVHAEKGQEPKDNDKLRLGLDARTSEYAEEILSPHFGDLIQFVKESERHVQNGQAKNIQHEEGRVGRIITAFSNNWKVALDTINRDVMSSFPSFRTGANVLQQALTLLVLYYQRFQKILNENLSGLSGRQDLINIHQLMVEVKKYKPNF